MEKQEPHFTDLHRELGFHTSTSLLVSAANCPLFRHNGRYLMRSSSRNQPGKEESELNK